MMDWLLNFLAVADIAVVIACLILMHEELQHDNPRVAAWYAVLAAIVTISAGLAFR